MYRYMYKIENCEKLTVALVFTINRSFAILMPWYEGYKVNDAHQVSIIKH